MNLNLDTRQQNDETSSENVAFVHRPPNHIEMEELRLVLSTFRDGTGMLNLKNVSGTLPGWRDFERSVAAIFKGESQESKFLFDVLIPSSSGDHFYGISCKMRGELKTRFRTGRVTMELSNASKAFQSRLEGAGISRRDFEQRPAEVGEVVIGLVEEWKEAASTNIGGIIDVDKSSHLCLLYDKGLGDYQLYWYGMGLPNPKDLSWEYYRRRNTDKGHIRATDTVGRVLFEYYPDSGGQLKYFPLAESAIWQSNVFQLEKVPLDSEDLILITKARAYFPSLWPRRSD